MKIVQLESSVYNKIAAGEVIERPASVVKELLENSLDAGATEVEIFIRGGGLEEIAVTDNGYGIEPQDMKTAFLPHATSKICCSEDLSSISTLGFRGEALASIASVAMVTVKSRFFGEELGHCLNIRGGDFLDEGVCGMDVGTSITVSNLFFNTPARLKFIKKPSGEEAEICALVCKMILANPDKKITLSNENGIVYQSEGNGLSGAIAAIYSTDLSANLIPICNKYGDYTVEGYTSKSTYSKSNRTYQTFIVNGRVCSNFSLSTALANCYSNYLMKRCYPVAIIRITMPLNDLDVNVHPTKAEVRFSDNNKIFSLIYHAVKDAVDKDVADNMFNLQSSSEHTVCIEEKPVELSCGDIQSETKSVPTAGMSDYFFGESGCVSEASSIEARLKENFRKKLSVNSENQENTATKCAVDNIFNEVCAVQYHADIDTDYRIIGQVFGTYILLEANEQFIIVDQHAAVEKTRYEHLWEEYKKGEIVMQPMLLPIIIDVSPSECGLVNEKLDKINDIGIDLQPFGNCSFKISAVPAILTDLNFDKFIREILSDKSRGDDALIKERLIYSACRSSIKGNTYLSNESIKLLLDGCLKHGLPVQCPHGRPAFVVYSKREIEKLFKRIV